MDTAHVIDNINTQYHALKIDYLVRLARLQLHGCHCTGVAVVGRFYGGCCGVLFSVMHFN